MGYSENRENSIAHPPMPMRVRLARDRTRTFFCSACVQDEEHPKLYPVQGEDFTGYAVSSCFCAWVGSFHALHWQAVSSSGRQLAQL